MLKNRVALVTGASRGIGLREDVAGAVLALASDSCGFVSGSYVAVSGGAYLA